MKNSIIGKYSFIFVFITHAFSLLLAQEIPPKPNPPRLVNDFTNTLSVDEINTLENKLVAFNDSTSNQIVVVMVSSFNGYTKEEYADVLGERWGVGQKDKDNGIVILVKPKSKSEKGEVRISVGYGLDGNIPDAVSKRIVEFEMIPSFSQNKYFEGIFKATDALIKLNKGEYKADQYLKRTRKKDNSGFGWLVPIIVIGIIFLFIGGSSGRNSRHMSGKSSSLPFWLTMLMLSNMGRGSSGDWGKFSGGGGFGGGSGGGFGGFGGGSFGGGGAGGSW